MKKALIWFGGITAAAATAAGVYFGVKKYRAGKQETNSEEASEENA